MKLGVLSVLLSQMPLGNACKVLSEAGAQAVEIGCGGFPGKAHCDPVELLADGDKRKAFSDTIQGYGLEISALSAHGNAIHPQPEVAQGYQQDFENAVLLAEKLGVDTVVTFSGCPGGAPGDSMPNWVTCPWPPDFLTILEYQWNDVLIPYWQKNAAFAKDHGVAKIALELHPGFLCYNPETLMRLREAVGPVIGANFDPSHLFWQGIDPVAAIRYLGDAIHYFHAKDTKVDAMNVAVNGVLDTKHFQDELHRSWLFRTVGYGHDYQVWKDMISALRMVGYDGVISIEHEDGLMSPQEGLEKAIRFLKEVVIFEEKGDMWWA